MEENSTICPKELKFLKLDEILQDDHQIRTEFSQDAIEALAMSIKSFGLIEPIIVSDYKIDGKYKIISGERRYRAFLFLYETETDKNKWERIPVTFLNTDNPISGVLANLARIELNPVEYAEALNILEEEQNLKQISLAKMVGKSKSLISEYLSLLELPEQIKAHAKSDSIVPFNFLKKLQSNKKLSPQEKIEAYYKKYDECKATNQTEDGDKKVNAPEVKNRITRLQNRLKTAYSSLEKIDAKIFQEVNEIDEVVTALTHIEERAHKLVEEITASRTKKFDASNSVPPENPV